MQADLRWILLVVGACVVIGIIWDAYKRSKSKMPLSTHEFEDTILQNLEAKEYAEVPLVAKEYIEAPLEVSEPVQPAKPNPIKRKVSAPKVSTKTEEPVFKSSSSQEVIALTIIARNRQGFTARSIEAALEAARFRYGPRSIYHRYADESSQEILYSIASVVEPGTLELHAVGVHSFPGLMMFMLIPTAFDSIAVFNHMVATAKNIARALNGDLCDGQRCHLTPQMLAHYREKIEDIQRRELSQKQVNEC